MHPRFSPLVPEDSTLTTGPRSPFPSPPGARSGSQPPASNSTKTSTMTGGAATRTVGSGGTATRGGPASSSRGAGSVGSAAASKPHAASHNVSAALSHRSSAGLAGVVAAAREKLRPVDPNLQERFCVHCRGPHRRNAPPHPPIAANPWRMECEFSVMYKASELPADKDSGSFMGGKDCLRWKVDGAPFEDFDIAYWLPIFVEGAQETTEPMRLIAITGSKQMIQADWSVIGPLIPAIVSRLRRALNSKTPAATAACLDIVRCLLTTHPGACDAMMRCDGYRRMAPVPNLFIKSKEMVRTGYELKMVGGQKERLCDVIDDVLNLMARQGGARGLALLKSYIPTFTPNKPAVPR